MNLIDFYGYVSKVKFIMGKYWINIVNAIECKPLGVFW